ncbi:Crp/Fnr family transcriptional regulator [Chryseobacterium sp. Chry.R1]|uniref:Crp/Fnr family transcriptional regulator n=1 Tax=Chryseobacterium sp. Chry.R1 TaxID=3139392 RepID=UPI0031F9CFC1
MKVENFSTNGLISFIKNTYPVSDFTANLIADNFEPVILPKHQLTLREGSINSDYIFLETGYMRSYVLDIDGNEVTTNIFKPNEMVFEVESYFQRKPSNENIETITRCIVWIGKYEKCQRLFHTLPEFREFGRAILVKGFTELKQRTVSMIKEKSERRYENLLLESPDIFRNVPLKFIASYLGITNTSLSRLRR